MLIENQLIKYIFNFKKIYLDVDQKKSFIFYNNLIGSNKFRGVKFCVDYCKYTSENVQNHYFILFMKILILKKNYSIDV